MIHLETVSERGVEWDTNCFTVKTRLTFTTGLYTFIYTIAKYE